MNTFIELMGVHERLKELFARHRDLIVGLEFESALRALDVFERALVEHMRDEDEHILPLYCERVGKVPGGDPELFHMEHRNILRSLRQVKGGLEALVRSREAGRRQAHEFLDMEWMLLHLMEHHDERERKILYPELDKRLSQPERDAVLKQCRSIHHSLEE